MLDTNVHGVLRMTRLCLPHIRDGGHIVNMGSIAGRQPYENAAVYITSKYAVRGFSYALREDLLGRPIHITTDRARPRRDRTSRAFASAATRRRPAPSTRTSSRSRRTTSRSASLFAVTRPRHVNIDELVDQGARPVDAGAHPSETA